MVAKKKPSPSTLQLFRQKRKIEDLQRKLYTEKQKLSDMIKEVKGLCEKLNVDGTIYEIQTVSGNHTWSWDNTVQVKALGTAEEFAKLTS